MSPDSTRSPRAGATSRRRASPPEQPLRRRLRAEARRATVHPFPGPQPYRATARALFVGREDLSHKLESRILAFRCVTVYGPSGAGKSSLVWASVIPKLVASSDVRVARVDGWPQDRPPTSWLASVLYDALRLGDPPDDLSSTEAVLTSLMRAARRSSRLILVCLDQFEQVLAEDRDPEAIVALFDCLQKLIELPFGAVRLLISLREDALGRFRDHLGERMQFAHHELRVARLSAAERGEARDKFGGL